MGESMEYTKRRNLNRGYMKLEVWNDAIRLLGIVRKVINGKSGVDLKLRSQILDSAQSISANIAEGYCRFHYQENIQFCRQTRGSLSELVDDLNICLDQEYFPEEQLKPLRELALEVNKQLNGYAAHRKRRKEET